MTSLTLSCAGILDRFPSLSWRRAEGRKHASGTDSAGDDAHARLDFVQDMIARNPDAFSSELDVQNVMLFFPDRF